MATCLGSSSLTYISRAIKVSGMLSPIQIARFWSRVTVGDRFACWEWSDKRNSKGYGICDIGGLSAAHRVAYTLIHGGIAEGLIVRHKCDNRPCCNPYHLETGTHADNATDRKNRGRNGDTAGVRNGRAKLTPDDVAYVLANPDGLLQRELATRFGVAQPTISRILLGRGWAKR